LTRVLQRSRVFFHVLALTAEGLRDPGRAAAVDMPFAPPIFDVRLHCWEHGAPTAEDRWFRSTILDATAEPASVC